MTCNDVTFKSAFQLKVNLRVNNATPIGGGGPLVENCFQLVTILVDGSTQLVAPIFNKIKK
jgi:hypothetical protein